MDASLETADRIDVERCNALAGVIGANEVREGEVLPPMWQLVFFLPRPRQSDLGSDGHPLAGFPTPPARGLRRMFAGGRLVMSPGITVGSQAVAATSVVSQREKVGRSGRLVFTTIRTEITVSGHVRLTDERDIVYLPQISTPAEPERPNPPPIHNALPVRVADESSATLRHVDVDPTMLFRFSALTYNAHRIHYDLKYARTIEGYPGLVVHGPLQALLMAEEGARLLERQALKMDYQLTSPLFAGEGMVVRSRHKDDTVDTSVTDRFGRVTAQARLERV